MESTVDSRSGRPARSDSRPDWTRRPTGVVVGEESESFVRECHNAFARFVRGGDSEIRPGDETLVVNEGDSLLAVGQAKIDSAAMADFHRGMAVQVRDGVDE